MAILDSRTGAAPWKRGFSISRAISSCLAGLSLVAVPVSALADNPPPSRDRYLADDDTWAKLGFVLPPAPPNKGDKAYGDIERADLDQVRAAQFADPAAKAEAFEDADSYFYEVLLPRFSVAAGRTLTITRRPILAHMLRWLLEDADAYHIKDFYYRDRPFLVDSTIQVCDRSYMMSKIDPPTSSSSYPSGHAAHGYLAGKLLSEVLTDRRDVLVARGVRFGTNRIICGVHFPTDVAMGQAFALYLYTKAAKQPQFQKDFACAVEEDQLDQRGKLTQRKWDAATQRYNAVSTNFSKDCQKADDDYFQEAVEKARDVTFNLWPLGYNTDKAAKKPH